MQSSNEYSAWMEITLTIPAVLVEDCSVILFEETGRGTYKVDPETDLDGPQRVRGFLPRDEAFRRQIIRLKKRIASYFSFFPEVRSPFWELRLIPSENWQDNWKRNFKPLKLSPTLVICPTWEEYRPVGREKVLRLDPGQAFGTGGHASTRLCLKVLESLGEETDLPRHPLTRVLDVGTGTGILALAAALFNARSVMAIDSDPLAVAAARLHVAINGFESIIRVEEGTAESIQGGFSLILANLTLADLLPLAGVLRSLLSPGGFLVLSGILHSQAKELIRAFVLRRLTFQCLYLEEEWAGVLFSKEPGAY
jgi:ribosomal protein L11 methyltransferase